MDGSIRIETQIDTKSFDKQISYLEDELNTLTKTLESQSKIDISFRLTKSEKAKLENDIESIKNRIISLREQKDKLENNKFQFTNLQEGFESALKSAKRLIAGVIGVRSAYFLIRKASSAYLQTDTATTQQLQNNWIGLGALMQEIITGITTAMKKLVTAILYFAQQLTGVNYIARANTAILKKQTKETNNLTSANKKLTASFDEMNVLQSDSASGGVSGGGIDESALFDINDLSENARTAIEKLGKALKPVYEMVKDIIKWALNNPEAVIAILGGLKLISYLSKILGFSSMTGGAGLLGIQGVLLAIASIGVIVLTIKTIYDSVIEAKKEIKEMTKVTTSANKELSNFADRVEEDAKKLEMSNEQVRIASKGFSQLTKENLDLANAKAKLWEEMGPLEKMFKQVTGEAQEMGSVYASNILTTYDQLKAWGELYNQGLLNEEESKQYIQTLNEFRKAVKQTGLDTNEYSFTLHMNLEESKKIKKAYEDTTKTTENLAKKAAIASGVFGNVAGAIASVQSPSKETNKILQSMIDTMITLSKNKEIKLRIGADIEEAKQKLNNLVNALPSVFRPVLQNAISNIKLAQGGIVNNPGRGVPIGTNIIAGEAGPEAVLPLDSETLSSLGRMIADNMVVNLTNINKMDGRVIGREIKKVNANEDFAFNR